MRSARKAATAAVRHVIIASLIASSASHRIRDDSRTEVEGLFLRCRQRRPDAADRLLRRRHRGQPRRGAQPRRRGERRHLRVAAKRSGRPGPAAAARISSRAARYERRRQDRRAGKVRDSRGDRHSPSQRLSLLLDADVDRTLQDDAGRAEAVGAGGSDRRRFSERAERGYRDKDIASTTRQRLRQRRAAVERLRRTRSPEGLEGRRPMSAARRARRHLVQADTPTEVRRRPLRDRHALVLDWHDGNFYAMNSRDSSTRSIRSTSRLKITSTGRSRRCRTSRALRSVRAATSCSWRTGRRRLGSCGRATAGRSAAVRSSRRRSRRSPRTTRRSICCSIRAACCRRTIAAACS